MILFEGIPELELWGPYDRNMPNLERILLVARADINLGRYGLYLGLGDATRTAYLLNDFFFWFGELEVVAGTWIFVYTGRGEMRFTKVANTDINCLVVHWNKPHTLFASDLIVPVLTRVGGVTVGAVPASATALPKPQG